MADVMHEGQIAISTRQLKDVGLGKSWASAYAWPAIRKFIVTKPLGTLGAAIILVMAFTALFADSLAPYDAFEINQSLQFTAPSLQHWLGTDEFGRDMLTRLIYGARIALFIGLVAAFIGATGGAFLGVMSAYMGGKVDLILQRIMDVMLAFPLLILALAIVSVLGRSIPNVVLAIAIPIIPRTTRIVRSSALSIKENMFVEAARAVGGQHLRVMGRHILPNVMAPYLIMLTAQLGNAILVEASLSFLGLGTTEPTPSWGLMLSGSAASYAEKAPWVAFFPGLAITLAVFGFNLFGDSLRDALDPKLRHRT
ncbi:MAG TPA: ABC transporter permease [Candidatus Tectomicrobia bacterium]|nr:ABC transporter permease [Candidatus Tectomicrobia bacterium]